MFLNFMKAEKRCEEQLGEKGARITIYDTYNMMSYILTWISFISLSNIIVFERVNFKIIKYILVTRFDENNQKESSGKKI